MGGSRGSRLDSLKAQREAAGLSQDALAKKANVALRTIVQLEALGGVPNATGGNCEPHEAQRICDALGIALGAGGHKGLS